MDKVIIKDLLARGVIGVNDWEREIHQDILINIEVFTDTRRVAETDSIEDCVSYSDLARKVLAHTASAARFTVERMVAETAVVYARVAGRPHAADTARQPAGG